jgi:hypothetical protein
MTWQAEVPKETEMIIKARWVIQEKDGSLKFAPWARIVKGEKERLTLSGKGTFFQFSVEMIRHTRNRATPLLSNITISIPCRKTKQDEQFDER